MERHDAVVVGGGPAALAAAACLRRAGLRAVVLERGRVGEAWRGRYDALHLHTIRSLSGLPGMAIPRACGRFVSRDDFVAYLERYAGALDVRTGTEARRVDEAWTVRTSAGDLAAAAVVVATGFSCAPHLPEWPGRGRFRGELLHSADYRNTAPYAGRDVLVVGAGNSGAEIAAELVRVARRVRLSIRTPPSIVSRERLGIPGQLLGLVTPGCRRAPSIRSRARCGG